jgi:hypothetical protein
MGLYNRDFGNGLNAGFIVGAFVTTLLWAWMLFLASSPCG